MRELPGAMSHVTGQGYKRMSDLNNIFNLINTALLLALMVGGFFAFRNGAVRTANEVQERVINALQAEVASLHQKISDLKVENIRLNQTINTIISALKARGLAITIDGDMVNIKDDRGHWTTTQIQEEM